jgi:Polysaccharide lyase
MNALLAAAVVVLLLVSVGNSTAGPLDKLPWNDEEESGSTKMPKQRPLSKRPGPPPSDTAAEEDPIPFWGSIDCVDQSRVAWFEEGGDPAPAAGGSDQGDTAFRRMTVLDGDDFFGERCELGLNDHRTSPVVFYNDGERLRTYLSVRLPENFPLFTKQWQGVMQMKQSQSADNADGTPALSLGAYGGRWRLFHSKPDYTKEDQEIWSTPAQNGVWTRFVFDVTYSANAGDGAVSVEVDLNGDGDFDDSGESSPRFETNTLKTEDGTDPSDGFSAGETLQSHLRVGIYHNEVIPCPPPNGCSVDIDNVQVVPR